MLKLFRVELEKLLYSRLLYAALAVFLIYALVMLAACSSIMGAFSGGTTTRPTGAVYLFLAMMLSFYPFLATVAIVFAGVSLSQERRSGTLRYDLLAPFARWKYLLAKFAIVVVAVCLVTLFLFLIIGGIATAFLGPGNVMTYDIWAVGKPEPRDPTLLNDQEIVRRSLLVLPFLAFSALANAAPAFLVSTLVESTILAITIPLSLFFISSIIQFSPFLKTLKPYLPTQAMFFFDEVFARNIAWDRVHDGLVFHSWLLVVFVGLSLVLFVTRDVTS